MFNWIGKIFGTDEAVGKVVDSVSNGLDKIWYTDEEKAEDKAQAKRDASAFIIKWMESTTGQNLARRLIAVVVTGVWVLQYIAMMALSTAAVWTDSEGAITSEKLTASAAIIGTYAESMNGAMMLILGFYFAAPHLGDIAKGSLEKFGAGRK